VAAIGPAGERQVRFASVVSDRTHQAARMGMGAVMGSKNLKAIVARGAHAPPLADPEAVAAIGHWYAERMSENPLATWQREPPGFAVWVHTHGIDAALDVENYRRSETPDAAAYTPERFMPHYQGTAPCPGCPNDCIKRLHVSADGDIDPRAGGIHQEITGTLGPNIGTADIAAILRANILCNEWGLDPASLGFVLSFAMECVDTGLLTPKEVGMELRFGDTGAALEMIRRIAFREGFGDVLAEGTKRAAARIGPDAGRLAMQVKGQELAPFEPRSQTNLALGYAVAPTGPRYEICEHDWDYDTQVGWPHAMDASRTLGILNRIPMHHYGPDKVRNFKALNTLWSGADTLLMCLFAVAPTRPLTMRKMAELVAAVTGWETSDWEIMRWGERRNHLMRVYNLREGLTAADDTLPDRFFDEPVPSGPQAGRRLDREKFQEVIQLYYQMMGWDEQGCPLPGTLYDHHLEWTLEPKEGR
jgi:aldehyde:ferredoxin oxidoreductase